MPRPSSNAWIVPPPAEVEPLIRLFCFPVAGGGSASFLPWSEHLPPQIQLCAVRLPGRETRLREPPFQTMRSLVAAVEEGLDPFFDRPFGLLGHCSGGLVAFELARALRRHGKSPPVGLFVSAQGAPHVRPRVDRKFSSLTRAELEEWLRQIGGTSEEVLGNAELMEVIEPTIRADFAIVENYQHSEEEPLAVPISVFGGRSDDSIGIEPLVEWRQHTSRRFVLQLLPADHFLGGAAWFDVVEAVADDLLGWCRRHIGS